MKKYFLFGLCAILLTSLSFQAYSQNDSGDDMESYWKKNIAISKFKILGVNQKQYAKCLETENYFEPDKKLKFLIIDKTSFADDGQGYDLNAGDGILTSNQLFSYTGNGYVLQGSYQESPDHNSILADEHFEYHNNASLAEKLKIIIGCKFKWVPCSQMSYWQAVACNAMGWPHGSFRITECELKIEF